MKAPKADSSTGSPVADRRGRRGVEPDQRHVDLIIPELDLWNYIEVITPGEKDPKGKSVEVKEELGAEETTKCQAIVARTDDLAADRRDIMYAVKKLCRGMGKPTTVMWHRLKRLGKYLVGSGRTVRCTSGKATRRKLLAIMFRIGPGVGSLAYPPVAGPWQ